MKNTKRSLWKWVLGACMVFAGVQSGWAGCAGTVHFKAPDSWTQAVFSGQNNNVPKTVTTRDELGYFVLDVSDIGLEAYVSTFSIANKAGKGNIIVTDTVWNLQNAYDDNAIKNMATLPCPGAGNDSYIMEDPLHEGKTYIGSEPSDAKFFYFLVPQDEGWQSDNVIIRIDGTTDVAMAPAANMCGWYYMAFDAAAVPSSVILYRKNDPTEQLGINGMAETNAEASPIPLKTYFNSFNSNTLYFIPDEDDWNDLTPGGWAIVDPGIPEVGDIERCSYKLAALIYDTDQDINEVFTSDGNTAGYGACVGVHKGIVLEDLDPTTKKPTFSNSPNAVKCFGNATNFNTLFNYTPNVNEVKCYDMPFRHYGKDTRWGFDSDSAKTDGYTGGFYPVENSTDADVVTMNGVLLGPTPKARTPRKAEAPVPVVDSVKNFDQYCTTPGWPGGVDCEGKFNNGDSPAVWNWGIREDWTGVTRNQQYCFESHAKFNYYEDQEFTFRGDDDIWVFINNKLVVDNGGAHLATPGHVVLKNLNDKFGAGFLVPGLEYDLDIFFCDRRTTMSNVIIKTNMYIRQKADITLTRDKNVPDGKSYDVCYTETGDGSCVAAVSNEEGVTCCGSDFGTKEGCNLDISYWLVEGRKIADTTSAKSVKITAPGVYNCIIDLTNFVKPTIGKADDVCQMGTGRHTLFMKIGNKTKKVADFRPKGEVDVLYADGVAYDTNGVKIPGGDFSLIKSEMGGELVPVYVTSVRKPDNATDPLEILPDDAINVSYSLDHDPLMQVFYKNEAGDLVRVTGSRTIGDSGIDTLYVTVDMADLAGAIVPFTINVTGRTNMRTINFYLPQIAFVSKPDSTGDIISGQNPADPAFEELWVGSVYDFYLTIMKPNDDGSYYTCTDCHLNLVVSVAETSEGIMVTLDSTATFQDGYATISVVSSKEYRYDTDATIHNPGAFAVKYEYSDYVKAVYHPVYFREPPVPSPRLADIFDTRGSIPSLEFKIPSPYFDMNTEYLDGIGDSVAIYYHRPIHKDSLPSRICLAWDSTSTEEHNPKAEGYSNLEKDTEIHCNALVAVTMDNIDCSSPDAEGYCTRVITIGGLQLSKEVKTMGVGNLISYAVFMDKGKEVKQGFPGKITDRIAPVPLSAVVRTLKNGDELSDYDSLVVTMSEPVKLLSTENKKAALDFYLNSAIELPEADRFASAYGSASTVVNAEGEPVVSENEDGTGRIKYLYRRGGVSPHVGDYVRLAGSMANVIWSDAADYALPGSDTLRNTSDAAFFWNSPTSYDETKRLPTPWISVTGDAEITVIENKFASTANAPAGDKVPAVTVTGYRTTMTKAEILADQNGIPGHLIKADMYALINGLDEPLEDISDVYFYFKVEYFTNLGGFVASKSAKIYCDDALNDVKFFDGGKCTDPGMDRNFYIGWNMRSDKGRVVGTGAYIVKLESYVKLGSAGKQAKQDETSVWGVKRSKKPVEDYKKDLEK